MIKSIINDFDLFVIDGENFGSCSIEKRMNERNDKSEKARQSALSRWGKIKADADAMRAQCDINAIKEKKEKERIEKESKGKENENLSLSKNDNQTPISPDSENPKPPKTPSEKIDYMKLAEYWNATTKFAKVTTMSDTRKKSINARFKEHGKHVIQQVIDKAAESKFLNGDNDKNWTANFDWIFKPTNFVKILEGNYDNRNKKKPSITDIWPELAGKEGIE